MFVFTVGTAGLRDFIHAFKKICLKGLFTGYLMPNYNYMMPNQQCCSVAVKANSIVSSQSRII